MSRDLPGLYWDAEKNRYFPLSSRTAKTHTLATTGHPQQPVNVGHQARQLVTRIKSRSKDKFASASDPLPLLRAKGVLSSSVRRRYVECADCSFMQLPAAQRAIASRALDLQVYGDGTSRNHGSIGEGEISAFAKREQGGQTRFIVGDVNGWIYMPAAYDMELPENMFQTPMWTRQAFLMSKITAVCMERDITVAISFGPKSRMLLCNDRSPDQMILKTLPDQSVYDVRAASLDRGSLILGASKKAAHIGDLESGHINHLRTDSDVFAICQRNGLAYTGARNGAINRFDLRDRTSGRLLFADDRRVTASVTTLNVIHEHELLTARINGSISTYDLRFTQGALIRAFHGHVCTYATDLARIKPNVPLTWMLNLSQPLCVDPNERFLFAAGQDNQIRIWSILTGEEMTSRTFVRHINNETAAVVSGKSIRAMQICSVAPESLSLVAGIGNELKEWSC